MRERATRPFISIRVPPSFLVCHPSVTPARMVGRSYSKGSPRGSGGRVRGEPSMVEGFSPFSMGRDDHPMQDGFSSFNTGRPMIFPSGQYMAMLQANSIPGYYPMMPNQEWLQQSTSSSRTSEHQLVDEDTDDGTAADEVTAAEELRAIDNTSTSSQAENTTVSQNTEKPLAYIRHGTIDVLEPSDPCSGRITCICEATLHIECLTWGEMKLDYKDNYFEEFKKHYTWPNKEEGAIQVAWDKKAKIQYPQLLSRIRKRK